MIRSQASSSSASTCSTACPSSKPSRRHSSRIPISAHASARQPVRPHPSDARALSSRHAPFISAPTHPPPPAHLLLALADVTAGDVVIDPMCGVGTLPVVGAAACAGAALCLGGDIEADCVAQARRLIQMSAHCAMRDSAVLCCVLITHSLRGVGASQRNRARRRGAALCRHELARAMPHRARIGHAVAHRAPALLDFGEFPRKSPRRAGGHV